MPDTTLQPATRISRREDVISERLLDETLILDAQSDRYVRLNAAGRWLWEALSAPRTVESLADGLAAEFGLDGRRALADVTAFVGDLLERQLVTTGARD